MANYVTSDIFIEWPLEDILSFYKKYEDKDDWLKFSPRKVISLEEVERTIAIMKKEDSWKDDSFYRTAFWLNLVTDWIERKEIKSEDDLPWYITFESKWIYPIYLIAELIHQNPHLWFKIKWCSDNYTKWTIIWKNWKIIFSGRNKKSWLKLSKNWPND